MTVSGKLVKEITRAELGELKIGRNITQYAWDGRDNFGDRLANGIYLYKVITKLNGSDIDKKASEADKFFVKEFGKMVLMR
jgi:flagellar hook assembly protein FlgD